MRDRTDLCSVAGLHNGENGTVLIEIMVCGRIYNSSSCMCKGLMSWEEARAICVDYQALPTVMKDTVRSRHIFNSKDTILSIVGKLA